MILTNADIVNLHKLYRDLTKYIGIRVKKIKENSGSYLMKQGLDINEILSSQFIPSRIASEIKRKADLDFHIEGQMGEYVISLYIFNQTQNRASTERSLSEYRSTESDRYGPSWTVSRPMGTSATLASYIDVSGASAAVSSAAVSGASGAVSSAAVSGASGSVSSGSVSSAAVSGTSGGAKVGKLKQTKNLTISAFKTLDVSDGLIGNDIINMLVDGLAFCLSSRTARHNYSFIIYPSDRLKELPSLRRYEDEFIQENNVNSGMTIVNMNAAKKSISAVVRREELGKVFLHELVHASLVDATAFGYFSSDLIELEQRVRKDLRISQATPLAIGESASEAFAQQLYFTMLSFRLPEIISGSRQSVEMTASFRYKLMTRELDFCRMQILKILYFYGFRKVGEFLKKTKSSRSMPKLATPTNIFGYFFIRYGLMRMFIENNYGRNRGVYVPVETSVYDAVRAGPGLVRSWYREAYKHLLEMLASMRDEYVADAIRPLEAEFPDIYELSLRFTSCDGTACWRGS
jgi:hypothetical protein